MAPRLTAGQRAAARAERTAQRRADMYADLIRAAQHNPADQLAHACDYLRAVADHLPPDAVRDLAIAVVGMANERNQP